MTSDDELRTPPRIGTSKKSRRRVLLWSGGALLLALLIGEVATVRVFLRNFRSDTGSTTAGPADDASADSISISFSNPVVEQGIQLVILAEDPTTAAVIEGVECHQLRSRPTTYAYFTIDPSFKQTSHFDLEAEVE